MCFTNEFDRAKKISLVPGGVQKFRSSEDGAVPQIVGRAGDVVLMHPLLIHSGDQPSDHIEINGKWYGENEKGCVRQSWRNVFYETRTIIQY